MNRQNVADDLNNKMYINQNRTRSVRKHSKMPGKKTDAEKKKKRKCYCSEKSVEGKTKKLSLKKRNL